MFWKKKKNKKEHSAPLVIDTSRYVFRVMPEEFLPKNTQQKKNSMVEKKSSSFSAGIVSPVQQSFNRTKAIGLIIMIVAFLAIIVGAVALFWFSFRTPTPISKAPLLPELDIKKSVNNNISSPSDETKKTAPSSAEEMKPKENSVESQNNVFPENTAPSSEKIIFAKGSDFDQDGLTDQEESLYGSESQKTDSDFDSFLDGEEIRNLYNPIGKGQLEETSFVKRVMIPRVLSFLIPSNWPSEENSISNTTFIRIPTGEFFQILISENPSKLLLSSWYKEQNSDSKGNEFILEYNNWKGIRSDDSLTIYLQNAARPEMIVVLFYNPLESNILYYETTFEMMMKSLSLVGE